MSHTFKILHATTGQQKVVHRNLIMPVNFLTLTDAISLDKLDVMSVSSSMDPDDEREVVADVYRTRAWVLTLPSETSSKPELKDNGHTEYSDVGWQFDAVTVPSDGIVGQSPQSLSQPDTSMEVVLMTNGWLVDQR